MADWTDQIVGDRMAVDQEFASRVGQSRFSRQQWGLIMTAVEFEIERPDDPERARIVADTSKLEHILPELDQVDRQMAAMGGAGGSPGGSSGGFVSSIKGLLGLDDGGEDDEQRAAAEALAQEYATELQAHLEAEGRWEQIRQFAAEE